MQFCMQPRPSTRMASALVRRSLLVRNRTLSRGYRSARKVTNRIQSVKSGSSYCSIFRADCRPRGLSTSHDDERNNESQVTDDDKSEEAHISSSVQSSQKALSEEYNLEKLLDDVEKHKIGIKTYEEGYSKGDERKSTSVRTRAMDIEELVELLNEENAQDVCVIKVPEELCYVNYFVVCTGASRRHLLRMAEQVAHEMKHVKMSQGMRACVEGRDSDDWMAVDLGNAVVHFMTPEARNKYELEKLWSLGPRYDDQFRSALKQLASRGDLPK